MEFPEHLKWLQRDPLAALNRQKLELLRSGMEVLDVSMINPDLSPPRLILDKLLEACVMPDKHCYAVSRGIKKLRQALAVKYQRSFEVILDPETQICASMGTKDALATVLRCFKKNSRVLIGAPVYPAYLSALQCGDFSYDYFEINAELDKMLADIQARIKTGSYQLLILNFPNNPTGITVDEQFYSDLVKIVSPHDVFVVNDFVYGEMCFHGQPASSLLGQEYFVKNGAEIYSLSKAYSVPGWRVGGLLGNEVLIKAAGQLKARLDYGIFLPVQLAAAAALSSDDDLVAEARSCYRERCLLVGDELKRAGWKIWESSAGCSVWGQYPQGGLSVDSLTFCSKMLMERKVFMLPGIVFGEQYNSFVRFAMVASLEKLHELVEHINNLNT